MAIAWTIEPPAQTSEVRGLHILLVEDNADSAQSMALLLGMNGHVDRLLNLLKGLQRILDR
jgi:hypothetical protein